MVECAEHTLFNSRSISLISLQTYKLTFWLRKRLPAKCLEDLRLNALLAISTGSFLNFKLQMTSNSIKRSCEVK